MIRLHIMATDWTKIYKKYKGLWVALTEDEVTVISANKKAKIALEDARKKGVENPILTLIPKNLESYVGMI